MRSFLVICKDRSALRTLHHCFHPDHQVEKAPTKDAGLGMLHRRRYDFVFVDLPLLRGSETGNDYKAALQQFWQLYSSVEVIVMCPPEMLREAVMAVKAGASNYLTYPLNPDEVNYVTESIDQSNIVQSELDYLRDRFWQSDSLEIVQTKNAVMRKVFEKIRSVAPTKSTVLLTGETGTGKGVLAKLIHRHSNRYDGPFISVHCGAIPDTLVESELFGHEKGAFTGAVRRKLGKFEIAKGGTILLDEVGTITPSAQIKLLQVLQDGTFSRVGGEETVEANVRVLAATNTDLKRMCADAQFRTDLYYRLNVFPIEIPPLHQRREDIPFFVDVTLRRLNKFHGKAIHDVHPLVLQAFQHYAWPGNIRELENLMERAYILATSSMLTPESFASEILPFDSPSPAMAVRTSLSLADFRRNAIAQLERHYLSQLLTKNKGRIKDAARDAGITTRQVHKLLTKHGLEKGQFKS
jgi:DNA-binding NtrC family response regulator